MNFKRITLLPVLFAAALLAGCNEPKAEEPYLNVGISLKSVTADEGSFDFEVESNTKWRLSIADDWISLSESEGEGNMEISCAYAGNKTASARSTQINIASLIEGQTSTYNIRINQQASSGGTVDPNPNPNPNPGTTFHTGWAELPAVNDKDGNGIDDNDPSLYYAMHLCAGGERNAQGNGKARNYTVCYSGSHHCPVWVAAPRHKMYVGSANRTNAYARDPDIESNIQYGSKEIGGGCNKGHMLGSAERTSSSGTNRQVFYYTNIAPQLSSSFNTGGGAWNNLEDYIDGLVCIDTLYEVVGCYFDTFTDKYNKSTSPTTISFGGRSDVSRPTMFYYALLRTKKGNSGKWAVNCSASELQCVAFVMRHTMEKGHEPQAGDMISVADLEKLTGFTYFPNVTNAPKTTFAASDWGL